jgi:hypothetical protein
VEAVEHLIEPGLGQSQGRGHLFWKEGGLYADRRRDVDAAEPAVRPIRAMAKL